MLIHRNEQARRARAERRPAHRVSGKRTLTGAVCTALFLALTALALFVTAATAAPVAAASLRIGTPHAWQVVQRNAHGRATIVVKGRLIGVTGSVEARWGDQPWTHGRINQRNGRFTLRLRSQPGGQATLQVRSTRRHAVAATRRYVGVGDIYVIAGQSNASGRSTILYDDDDPDLRASSFGNDYRWQNLRDPTDSAVGQRDSVSRDRCARGSVWPLVATELMQAEDVPVAFVPCARGSTAIARWQPAIGATPATKLVESMVHRIAAVGGKVRAILFWQGEADARLGTPASVYRRSLRRLARAVYRRCGAPMVVAQIGDYRPQWCLPANVTAIRLAQSLLWGTNHIIAGPSLYDVSLHNRVHFVRDDEMRTAAARWSAAILAGVFGREDARSPRLLSATYDGDVTIDLLFDPGDSPLRTGPVEGIVVTAGGEEVTVQKCVALSQNMVRVTLDQPQTLDLCVTLGAGRTATGVHVPKTPERNLPPRTFFNKPVTTDASAYPASDVHLATRRGTVWARLLAPTHGTTVVRRVLSLLRGDRATGASSSSRADRAHA